MRPEKDRIALAIPYVRVARRRLLEYREQALLPTPEELHRLSRLLEQAHVALEGPGYEPLTPDEVRNLKVVTSDG